MQSVACRGEELLSQQTTPNGERCVLLMGAVLAKSGSSFLYVYVKKKTTTLTFVFSVAVLQMYRTCPM